MECPPSIPLIYGLGNCNAAEKKEQFGRCKAVDEEAGLAGLGLEEATCRVADKDKLMPPPEKHLKKVGMVCIKHKPHKPREVSAK